MKKKIIQFIQTFDKIIIHRHVRPDPDALGSQGGLARIIKDSFPEKQVFIVGEEEPSLTFLVKMDDIPDSAYNGALVIICDTANVPRISDERYKLGEMIIKIDHHPNEDPYGDLLWVDPSASSVSEMIMELYLAGEEEGLVLSKEAARLLYAGIIGDTGRFLYSNTTENTFKIAGELIKKGFSAHEIYENLYKTEENLARLNGYVLQNFKLIDGCVGYIHLNEDDLQTYGVTASEASLLVNAFSHVKGLLAWVFFVNEPDQIRVRLRSKGPIVNGVAARFNGGGHPRASGATLYHEEDIQEVIQALRELCSEYKITKNK